MRNWLLFYLSFIVAGLNAGGVTYSFTGGRFGDNLVSYLHAKWFSYHYQVPLLYRPFPFSNFLVMDRAESLFNLPLSICKPYTGGFVDTSHVYIVDYFPESASSQAPKFFPIEWKNKDFRQMAKEMVSPLIHLDLIYPPQERISLALHVREGGGFDPLPISYPHRLKLPQLHFYTECLKLVLELFPDRPLYCYVFTDSRDPKSLVEQIEAALPQESSIQFSYREWGNWHDKNVLEDFFSLFNFDILIRPESNFSIIPSRIHDYAAVFSPKEVSGQQYEIRIEVDEALVANLRENKL